MFAYSFAYSLDRFDVIGFFVLEIFSSLRLIVVYDAAIYQIPFRAFLHIQYFVATFSCMVHSLSKQFTVHLSSLARW